MAWATGDAADASFNENPDPAWQSRRQLAVGSRPCLSGAVDAIFEAGKLLDADRAAGVEFSRGDADFGAEAEFATIGELRRRVMQHDRRIDLVEEFFRGRGILGHDRVGVM